MRCSKSSESMQMPAENISSAFGFCSVGSGSVFENCEISRG